MQTINNLICLLITAAVFAMIGIEYGNALQPTHSGTQSSFAIRKQPHAPTPLRP